MIGGMVGNNSSGTTSIEYGTTRDKVVEMEVLLADGAKARFGALTPDGLTQKCALPGLEGDLYRQVTKALNNKEQQAEIREQFPKSSIHRRNTGYAVDALLETAAFTNNGTPFNFCKLLCGSEGTLAFTTEIKLQLDPLPLPDHVVVAVHFSELDQSMRATQIAMRHQPSACEFMD